MAGEVRNKESRFRLVPAFADFDDDDDIDGTDFLTWQRNVGTGTTRSAGDADGDGDVDADDLAIWENSYGRPAPAALSASSALSVPEPSSFCLATRCPNLVGNTSSRSNMAADYQPRLG